MATARLGYADLLLRDQDLAWGAIDLIGSGSRRTATGQPRVSLSLVRSTPMGNRRILLVCPVRLSRA
jgi:hypothetical protein